MKRKDSEALIQLINDKTSMDCLTYYMELRVSALKERLIQAQSWEETRTLQGAIEELRRIPRLRDEVLNPDKE